MSRGTEVEFGARAWRRLLVALAILALAFFPARLFAQSPAPVQSFRFSVFAARPVAGLTFVPRANAAPQPVTFYPTARSPRYEYRGPAPLRFADESGAVVAEASVPADIRDVLLLFIPVEQSGAKLKYQIAVLDDAGTKLAAGALAFVNLSGLSLAGTVNRETATLKPGLNPPVSVGAAAKIELRTTAKNRSYRAYTADLPLGRNQRALIFLFPPFYKGSLEVQSRVLIDQPGK